MTAGEAASARRGGPWPEEALRARPQLVSVARRVVRDRAEAEDAADEALARLSTAMANGEAIDSIVAWLTRITLRIAVDRARAWVRRQRDGWRLDVAARSSARGAIDPGAALASVEARERIWRAILELPDRQRETLVLRQFEGMSVAEVAARLEIEEPTVRAHVHAARAALRRVLFEDGEGGDR